MYTLVLADHDTSQDVNLSTSGIPWKKATGIQIFKQPDDIRSSKKELVWEMSGAVVHADKLQIRKASMIQVSKLYSEDLQLQDDLLFSDDHHHDDIDQRNTCTISLSPIFFPSCRRMFPYLTRMQNHGWYCAVTEWDLQALSCS